MTLISRNSNTLDCTPSAPLRAPGVPLSAIDAIYNKFGPTPRLCFETEDMLIKYEKSQNQALRKLSLDYLENVAIREHLAWDAVSHKIYMMRRPTIDVDTVSMEIEFISPFIASKVMWALKRHELVRLFNRYHAVPSTRKMSGDVFEAYCHLIFSTNIELDFVPMVRIGGQPTVRKKKKHRWHSSHTKFSQSAQSTTLEVLCKCALTHCDSLHHAPSRVVECLSNEIKRGIETNVYYIPIKMNEPGINSILLHDGILYLFQMSVSDTHGISDKLWTFLRSLKGIPPKENWRFIFVKRPGNALACPVPQSDDLLDLALYSAEVEVTS